VGFGLVLMTLVVTFYAVLKDDYPVGVFIFYWIVSLLVVAVALVSVFACIDWLDSHARLHPAEIDASFNVAVLFFNLTLFAVALVALFMSNPLIVERLAKGRRPASAPDTIRPGDGK
jgi:hypothetical protein